MTVNSSNIIEGPWGQERVSEKGSQEMGTKIPVFIPQGYRAVVTLLPDGDPVTSTPNYGKIKGENISDASSNLWKVAYDISGGVTALGQARSSVQGVNPLKKTKISNAFIFSIIMFFMSALITGAFVMLLLMPNNSYVSTFTAIVGFLGGIISTVIVYYEGVGKELRS